MTSNLPQFTAQVKAFDASVPGMVVREHRRIVLEALRRIVLRTPVDKGRARGGWQVTIGSPAGGDSGAVDPSGGSTISAGLSAVAALPPYSIVYISSNVPYIRVLEDGEFEPPDPGPSKDPRPDRKGKVLVSGGYSTQAPQGMVAITVQELLAFFAAGVPVA